MKEVEVYFSDLSKRVQEKIKKWKYVDKNIINDIYPTTIIFPEDVRDFIEEYNDDYDYGVYKNCDNCDDYENRIDCEKCYGEGENFID